MREAKTWARNNVPKSGQHGFLNGNGPDVYVSSYEEFALSHPTVFQITAWMLARISVA